MRCGCLDSAARGWDESFEGSGIQSSCEFLLLRLDTWDNGDGEEVFVDLTVEVEDLSHLSVGFGFGEEGGVAFLPEELARAEEWLWVFEFPTNNAVPLVEFEWEVAMTSDPFGVV